MADNFSITPGVGAKAATDEVSYSGETSHVQLVRRVGTAGSEGAKTVVDLLEKSSRSDTFTGAANGTSVDVSALGMSKFAMQVKGNGGSPSAWNIVLEGSLDGATWTTLIAHTNTTHTLGATAWLATPAPMLYFRSRCVSVTLSGATNIEAIILAKP